MSSGPATSIAAEKKEQSRWKLRPIKLQVNWFEKLLLNEFRAPEQQRQWEQTVLSEAILHAATNVPHYRRVFSDSGLTPESIRDPADLKNLPVLTRGDLQTNFEAMKSTSLPPGHRLTHFTKTSGSTGQPVTVFQTNYSGVMFPVLRQRGLRWFRFDPMGTMATLREVEELPRQENGEYLREGMTFRAERWKYVGAFFHTGPSIFYAYTNPLEKQIAWLEKHRPDYLISMPASLEHLAFGLQGRTPPDSLKGLHAISQQLTQSMRSRIEREFGLTVNQNYGLNEVGLVAVRCPEGGRYHVHTEHCLVEITDDDGNPCKPGQPGHLLVTCISNKVMPLIRYDTGDLATCMEGPCPCGRTLPSFGEIQGRYRRIAPLPPGTWPLWEAMQRALDDMPKELSASLRQYQMHQFRDGHFKLRLAVAAPLPEAFTRQINAAWGEAAEGEPPRLEIEELSEIPKEGNRKFENFTSDFV